MTSKITQEETVSSPGTDNIVDRVPQRDAFVDVIERMRSGMPFSHNLFEWYGPPGIGKTTLVVMLNSECRQRDIPHHLIDFKIVSDDQLRSYTFDPILIVEDMVNSLIQYHINNITIVEKIKSYQDVPLPPEGVCTAYARMTERDRSYSDDEWLIRMRLVLSALMDSISSPIDGGEQDQVRPFVLFIDDADKCDELLSDWIEEFLVKPMVQTKRCVVVWTARHQWKWKRPEIRWDRKSEELRAFTQDEVKEQLSHSSRLKEDNLAEQFFKNIHIMTGGHPYAGTIVIEQIDEWKDVNVDVLKQRESELYKEINKQVIQNYAFKGLPLEQRTALELCSMVRLIDITTLQHILQECADGKYKKWQRKQFDQLLLELRKTYLLKWGKSGWTLEPSLRYLMRNYYLSCAKDTFKKVNEVALKVYQDWLLRPVDNRKLFLIEEIYHYISLKQLNIGEIDIVTLLDKRLEEYPSLVQDDVDGWRYTLEQIEGEIEHDEEITKLLGEDAVQQLIFPIRKRIKKLLKVKKE
jgi:hypothetical protein